MNSIKKSFKEILRYPSAIIGLLIIFLLVVEFLRRKASLTHIFIAVVVAAIVLSYAMTLAH